MWLLLAFVAIPMIEIALFIQVGGFIGLGPTLAIVLLTAFLGAWLVRAQGSMAISNLRGSFSRLEDPTEPLAHGAMILISGALLLTPGFFTDGVGFALLMPPVRSMIFRFARSRIKVQHFEMGAGPQQQQRPEHWDETVIDGEFTEIDPTTKPTHTPSGWTKH